MVTREALDYLAAATRAGATLTGVADDIDTSEESFDNDVSSDLPGLRVVK